MRQLWGEYSKLFLNRIFVICLCVALIANSMFLLMTQSEDIEDSAIASDVALYEQIIEDCTNSADKEAFIESKHLEIQIALRLLRLAENGVDVNVDASASKYKEEHPEEFAKASEFNLTADELNNLSLMISDISSQLAHIDSFDEFITNMKTRAEEQSGFAIFAKPNSFSYKNIQKTPVDFERVADINPTLGNNKALEVSTTFELTDYLLLVLILLVCIAVFTVEREKGLYSLVRSTKNGRLPTIVSKLFVCVSVTAVMSVLFYACNVLISGAVFGFGDMSRCVQSSSMFMNCTFDVTIRDYLILWVSGKTLFLCAFALSLSLLFTAVKSPALSYIILGVFGVFEFGAYMFVNGTSTVGALKYINIFYLLSGNNIFGVYQNVNVFSEPVGITVVFIILVVLLSIVGVVGSSIAFSKSNMENGKIAVFQKLTSKINSRKKIKGSTSIYKGEAFKHYKTSFAFVAIVLLLIVGYQSLNEDLSIKFKNTEESYYNTYMQTLEGELTSDKCNFIQKEREYFDSLELQKAQISADTSLSDYEKEERIQGIQNIIETKGQAFETICKQVSYAESKAVEISKPPALINELVNKRFVQDTYREWKCFTLLLAVIAFCTSNILACEYKKSMVNLISATKFGKGRLLSIKLMTVMITSVISYILVYLPYWINLVKTFGTGSFDLPLAFVKDFYLLISDITVFEYLCVLNVLHLLVAITATALIYMLSYLLKNQFVTMIVSSGLFLIPCVLFINNTNVRTVAVFLNNTQKSFVILVVTLCLLATVISVAVTFVKFNRIKWRVVP
ncbi:MAG: hypothetical protein IJ298_06475 [Ruminococcus sp.]|nr:hypothetical protein [Ruminococcus sp.]